MFSIINRIKKTFQLGFNPFQSLILNLKILPFKDAIKMPVCVYGKTTLIGFNRNSVKINAPIKSNMIRIGGTDCMLHGNRAMYPSYFALDGKIIFNGYATLSQGMVLKIDRNGTVELGNNSYFGPQSKIYCQNKIIIGDLVRASWNSQFFDTNFHYSIFKGKIKKLSKEIIIGNNVWVGNHSNVMRGAKIPAHSVIASNSLVNKDFSAAPEASLFAGIPAKFVTEGIERVFDFKAEEKLDAYFERNQCDTVEIDNPEIAAILSDIEK